MSRLLGEGKDGILGRPIDALPHGESERTVALLHRLLHSDETADGVPLRVWDDGGDARDCVMSPTVLARGAEPRRLWVFRTDGGIAPASGSDARSFAASSSATAAASARGAPAVDAVIEFTVDPWSDFGRLPGVRREYVGKVAHRARIRV